MRNHFRYAMFFVFTKSDSVFFCFAFVHNTRFDVNENKLHFIFFHIFIKQVMS